MNLFYNNPQITKHKDLFPVLFLLGSIWHPTTFFRELSPFPAPLMPLSSKLVNLFSTLAGSSSTTSPSPQVSSAAQSCLTLCNPMVCSTPGFPILHQLPELAQTQVHQVSDAIQPSLILCRPLLLLPPTPPSIRVFSNESVLRITWPKYRSFSFSISPSKNIQD